MDRLIPLSHIPHSARGQERAIRSTFNGDRSAMLEYARYEIVSAPGCHNYPSFDPPRIGWVLSRAAAVALSERLTHMPGNTHCGLTFKFHSPD